MVGDPKKKRIMLLFYNNFDTIQPLIYTSYLWFETSRTYLP